MSSSDRRCHCFGTLVVESTLGEGTTVAVTVPRTVAPAAPCPHSWPEPSGWRRLLSTATGLAIRVLLADGHPVVRDGLAAMPATESDLTVVGEAASGVEALRQTAAVAPDVVLMDLQMSGVDGTAPTAAFRAAHPEVRVLVLTIYDTDVDITAAVGAVGYLLKDTGRHELCAAVRTAVRGGAALSPHSGREGPRPYVRRPGAGLSGRDLKFSQPWLGSRATSRSPAPCVCPRLRSRPIGCTSTSSSTSPTAPSRHRCAGAGESSAPTEVLAEVRSFSGG